MKTQTAVSTLPFSTGRYKKIIAACIGAAFIVTYCIPLYAFAAESASNTVALGMALRGAGLPVAQVDILETPNARGTVIYIPQIHKNPGSRSSDRANDTAVAAQTEIYSVIEHAHANSGVRFVMAEGEMYGEALTEKINALKAEVALRGEFENERAQLKVAAAEKSVDGVLESNVLSLVDNTIEMIHRDIMLAGADHMAKVDHEDIVLYGAEDPATYQKSAEIVRDYLYVQDRMGRLGGGTSIGMIGTRINTSAIQAMLATAPTAGGSSQSVTALKEKALLQGDQRMAAIALSIEQSEQKLKLIEQSRAGGGSGARSRDNNPYNSVSDMAQLQRIKQADEQKIKDTVIDQRNRDVARNFVAGIAATGQETGILTFGSGHTEGLVSELERAGLSVIIVTPNSVAARGGKIPAPTGKPIPAQAVVQPQPSASPTMPPVVSVAPQAVQGQMTQEDLNRLRTELLKHLVAQRLSAQRQFSAYSLGVATPAQRSPLRLRFYLNN